MNRRPVSQQRYAVRRLGVAAVLAVAAFGAVKGVASLSENKASGEEPPASSPGSGPTTVGAGEGAAAATPTTPAPTTQPPPATEADRTGPPTEDQPARVLVIGDSDAGTFGPYLQRVVEEWGVVEVELDYKSSTGLSRPDYHDWPGHLRNTLSSTDPDIIVVTFGGNDAQGISERCANGAGSCQPDWVVGSPTAENNDEWTAAYVGRVNEMMDIMLEDPDRTVIWVGIPNDIDSPEVTDRLRIQDQSVRRAMEDYPDAMFVDTWKIFDGINGGAAELVVDPRTGNAIPVRAADGFHLNEDGADILAIKVSDRIEEVLVDMGADI